MEQRTLPLEQDSPLAASAHVLVAATDRSEATLLHTANPTSGTDQVEVSGAELSRLAHQSQKRVGRAIWSMPATYAVATVLLLSGNYLLGHERGTALISSPLFYLPVLLLWAGFMSFMVSSIVKPRKQCRQVVQTLASLDDVRAVGSLIDTWKMEDGEVQKISNQALIALLPRLRPDDAHLLNAAQRTVLCRVLSRGPRGTAGDIRAAAQPALNRKVELRIAILQAFAQVGDSSALPVVQRLAMGEAKTAEQKRIQAEAQACLPTLKLRIEQMRNPQTLLRAADASHTGTKTLLRAAKGVQETPPDQLLRPGPPDSYRK